MAQEQMTNMTHYNQEISFKQKSIQINNQK